MRVGRLAGRLAHQVDGHGVALLDRARPSTGSYRAARSRKRCRVSSTASSWSVASARRSCNDAYVPQLEGRDGVERRRELQRLPLFDDHVADVGRLDRLETALPQRVVDRARHQLVHDVVEDLVLEALLDDPRRHLARPEARDARGLAVVARHPIDLGIDRAAVDLHDEVLAGLADVDEFGLHVMGSVTTREVRAGTGSLRKGGVEPPWPYGHRILSPARLPVPPLSHADD